MMPLVPFEPFRNVDRWRKEFDRFFNEGLPSMFGFQQEFAGPRVDVFETDTEVVCQCEIPGLEKKEDVDIHVENNALVIQGNINKFNEVKDEQVYRRERYTGRFYRTVPLPADVEAEGTTASYRNGILEVRMPKSKQQTRRHIDVQFH